MRSPQPEVTRAIYCWRAFHARGMRRIGRRTCAAWAAPLDALAAAPRFGSWRGREAKAVYISRGRSGST